MRAVGEILQEFGGLGGPRAAIELLRERIALVEAGAKPDRASVSTGWNTIDVQTGGLRRGAIHEWFGVESGDVRSGAQRRVPAWTPPLVILAHLAKRAGASNSWTAWIGRRVWPSAHAIGVEALARCLFIDPRTGAERLWAIDAALRVSGLVVVGDGSGLDAGGSRRLQLAAEAGGSLGLLARQAHEAAEISVAATRWSVARARSPTGRPAWSVRLVRCKGVQAMGTLGAVVVERRDDGAVECLSPDVGERADAAPTRRRLGAGHG